MNKLVLLKPKLQTLVAARKESERIKSILRLSNTDEYLFKVPTKFQKLHLSLIMRNKPDIDEIDIDDLYNNLRVYEDELKRSSGSNSASQNLAFLSFENTNSTNELVLFSRDFGVSTAGGINQVPITHSKIS
ncbi:hypothetical protein Tco_1401535 [Tanacetum coccineum]